MINIIAVLSLTDLIAARICGKRSREKQAI